MQDSSEKYVYKQLTILMLHKMALIKKWHIISENIHKTFFYSIIYVVAPGIYLANQDIVDHLVI